MSGWYSRVQRQRHAERWQLQPSGEIVFSRYKLEDSVAHGSHDNFSEIACCVMCVPRLLK